MTWFSLCEARHWIPTNGITVFIMLGTELDSNQWHHGFYLRHPINVPHFNVSYSNKKNDNSKKIEETIVINVVTSPQKLELPDLRQHCCSHMISMKLTDTKRRICWIKSILQGACPCLTFTTIFKKCGVRIVKESTM